jgi:hypothetical protein
MREKRKNPETDSHMHAWFLPGRHPLQMPAGTNPLDYTVCFPCPVVRTCLVYG